MHYIAGLAGGLQPWVARRCAKFAQLRHHADSFRCGGQRADVVWQRTARDPREIDRRHQPGYGPADWWRAILMLAYTTGCATENALDLQPLELKHRMRHQDIKTTMGYVNLAKTMASRRTKVKVPDIAAKSAVAASSVQVG
ncbi:MAG: hypothetical protein ACYC4B_20510 [Pirellulaceae bacterium]